MSTPGAVPQNTPPDPKTQRLLRALQKEAPRQWQTNRLLHGLMFFPGLYFSLTWLQMFIGLLHGDIYYRIENTLFRSIVHFHVYLSIPLCILLIPTSIYDKLRRKRVRHLVEQLSNDTRAVGPLLLLLHRKQSSTLQTSVKAALRRLLPQMRASDAPQFTPLERQVLLDQLRSRNVDWVLLILQTLQRVGDAQAYTAVARLARSTRNQGIREAAEACLPFLQSRAEERNKSGTLLRAAEHPSSPDTLLRAAVPTVDASGELLRAAHDQQTELLSTNHALAAMTAPHVETAFNVVQTLQCRTD